MGRLVGSVEPNTETMRAFILVGPPASGKTSYVHTLRRKVSGLVHIEGDKIREGILEECPDEGYYSKLQDGIESAIADAAGSGNDVVVDGCNYSVDIRQWLAAILQSYGYSNIEVIVLLPSLSSCLQWNQKRKRQVPDYVVKMMHRDVRNSLPTIGTEGYSNVEFVH